MHMKHRTPMTALALGVALLGLGAGHARAAEAESPNLPDKGTREVGVAGFLSFNGDNPYDLNVKYGQYVTKPVELGVEAEVAGAKHAKTFSSIGGRADLDLAARGSLLPYVGAFLGYAHETDNNASVGGQVGAKYFFNPNVAFVGEVQFRSTRHASGTTQLLFGFSTFFR